MKSAVSIIANSVKGLYFFHLEGETRYRAKQFNTIAHSLNKSIALSFIILNLG